MSILLLVSFWVYAIFFYSSSSQTDRGSLLYANLQEDLSSADPPDITSIIDNMRVGIVSMMHRPSDVTYWLNHHMSKGVTRFYLRVETDDAYDDDVVKILSSYPQVALEIGKPLDVTEGRGQGMNDTPGQAQMLRQRKWVADAIRMSIRDGVHWLVHIDSDELLDCGDLRSVQEAIIKDAGSTTHTMVIKNVEAIYSKDKLGNSVSNSGANCFVHKSVRDCERDNCASYANGKSIGRVSPFLREAGVHRFHYEGPEKNDGRDMKAMRVIHFESCDFNKYVNKFLMLAGSEKIKFPFNYYNDSIAVARSPECLTDKDKDNESGNDTSNTSKPLAPSCSDSFKRVYSKYRVIEDFINKKRQTNLKARS